jgi:hypothetical protein
MKMVCKASALCFYSVNLKKFAKNLEEFAKVSKLPNWKKNISYG